MMTESDFIETAMARLVVTAMTPAQNALNAMILACALWRARSRTFFTIGHMTGFVAELPAADQEFIDLTALTQQAGAINFTSAAAEFEDEARKRYQIAIQRWQRLRDWKEDTNRDRHDRAGATSHSIPKGAPLSCLVQQPHSKGA